MPEPTIRIVIIEDRREIREGLRTLIAYTEGYECVAAYRSMEEALPMVAELTSGAMADAVILTPGVMYGSLMPEALSLTGKGGTCVVTAVAPQSQKECGINLFELAMYQKEVRGVVFGAGNPRYDIPNLLALYRAGQLKLDEMITRSYRLDQINQGYQDMLDGVNIRGVITFE